MNVNELLTRGAEGGTRLNLFRANYPPQIILPCRILSPQKKKVIHGLLKKKVGNLLKSVKSDDVSNPATNF